MAKPIRDTFLGRVFLLLRGMIFYNTVYWRRASDGLQPPRLSRSEREQNRPSRDLSAIKPREKPRAKAGEEEIDLPEGAPSSASKGFVRAPDPLIPVQEPLPLPQPAAEVVRKKRRRVRLQSSHTMLDSFNGPSLGSKGLLDRFFKKKE